MAMETRPDDEVLSERIAQLGSARTELGLDRTITDRTVEASTEAVDTVIDPGELPRITVDTPVEHSILPLAEKRRPDLALVATIGEGGMGRVHLARQRSLGRDVAVKTLKSDATPAVAQALLREARVTGSLEHPGVIPVHALGVDEQRRPMLVMKRVHGVDLSSRLGGASQAGDDLASNIEILISVCRTLEFAHSRGVVHRDIKPENIMVGEFGEVYLLDWGIATTRLGAAGAGDTLVGTVVYMAPEMVLGRGVDARTDVYLLGATLHEVLTGRVRHAGKTMLEVTKAAMFSPAYSYGDDTPTELASLCNRATARDPKDRPQTAAAFREELSAFLRHRSARAIADAALERVAELEVLLSKEAGVPKDLARAYRLVAEARFGLTQSLRDDEGALSAREGVRRCIVAAVEIELRQDHVESAAALVRELDAPDPDLQRRIEERRDASKAREREHERLASLERDLDPSHNARQRSLPMIALTMGLVGLGGYVAARGSVITPVSLVAAGCVASLALGVGITAMRKRLLTNAFNRRIAMMLFLGTAIVVANRVAAIFVGRGVEETLAGDLLLLTAVMAASAVALLRRLWICTAILAVSAVLAWARPDHAAAVFTLFTLASLMIGAWILRHVRPGD